MTMFTPFHSAVNRIPVLRTLAQDEFMEAEALELFRDGQAAGHDHLGPERWSGSIDLEMTVRTPLVFGEQRKTGEGRDERHFVDLPLDDDGKLVMPPTMVKGMVSRAFETLTCSRFRVFGDVENRTSRRRTKNDHSERLTYRGDPASALQLVPIRLRTGDAKKGFTAELLHGDTQDQGDYREGRYVYPTMKAASLQGAPWGSARLVLKGGINRLESMTLHQGKIRCHMTLCLHGDRGRGARYAYWQVTHIRNDQGEFEEAFRIKDSVTTIEDLDDVVGYVYRTTAEGDSPKQLFNRKHDERVFFGVSRAGTEKVTVTEEVCEAYRIVVNSYIAQRKEEESLHLPKDRRHRPNRATDEARRKLEAQRKPDGESAGAAGVDGADGADEAVTEPATLKAGDLAYAVVEERRDGSHVVRELLPVMIGRRAYQMSPRALAEAQKVVPLKRRGEASAADRVFGYVVPSAEDDAVGGDVAARGHVSFGAVDASKARIEKKEKKLVPLLAPKPTSARRFLTDASGRTPTRKGGAPLARGEYFAKGQLLGAAAYPVHHQMLDKPGFPQSAITAYAEPGVDQSNESVRLHVRSWVATGSVLRCTMSFSNLSAAELGALIWVLTPKNLVPAAEKQADAAAVGYLRMGLGKPLGLGVLEVRIAPDGLRVVRGDALAAGYEDLSGCLGSVPQTTNPEDFPLPDERALVTRPWVQAMQRAAFGYSDGRTVRHMLLDENKANNQTDFRSGAPKPGCGQAPGDMVGTGRPKPTTIQQDERQRPRGNQNRGHHGHRR